jgi:serine/threonine protein kinase
MSPLMALGNLEQFVNNRTSALTLSKDGRPDYDPRLERAPIVSVSVILDFLSLRRDTQAQSIAAGLAYLHLNKTIHGDICAVSTLLLLLYHSHSRRMKKNILIGADRQPMIADFGLTIVGERTNLAYSTSKKHLGHMGYIAPELINDPDRRRNEATDVFSYGCVCYVVRLLSHLGPQADPLNVSLSPAFQDPSTGVRQNPKPPTRCEILNQVSLFGN